MSPSTGPHHAAVPTTRARRARRASLGLLALALPFTLGARGDGCAASSRSPAPDVTGEWAITYDDVIDVEVAIGGAVYQEQISA